ncbi:putative acetyltransferase [Prochlorococcus sp. MIT 0702]|nr:putative acetyltransferase [Prochlorococcus sp. MIT 0701]KGG27879.1 putative acetyltransferase [Prochlorococcus sp. MIT 0702]KGG31398.1 putative acetyltransferase [Prochlorococcus sp. MIT 0703]
MPEQAALEVQTWRGFSVAAAGSLRKYCHQKLAMAGIRLIQHAPGAPGLRWLGLGPGLKPTRGLLKLQRLLNKHAFWAQGRSTASLRKILAGSNVIISLWRGKRLVGFGRATSDGICRAVLWDIVVAGDLQGHGFGRQVIDALLAAPGIRGVERVYLMTTKSQGFYEQLGFENSTNQQLLLLKHKNN